MEVEEILEKYQPVWRQARPIVVVGLTGLILLALGILAIFLTTPNEPQIEILPVGESAEENNIGNTILVDLAGAVQKPGVYELPFGSRLNDLLILAGGLSASADREWLDKNINLAQKLTDGVKIYIPPIGEVKPESKKTTNQININTASAAQLETLWGIGEARAKAIIAGRPYQASEDLLTRKIVPQNVFEKIKNEITVY